MDEKAKEEFSLEQLQQCFIGEWRTLADRLSPLSDKDQVLLSVLSGVTLTYAAALEKRIRELEAEVASLEESAKEARDAWKERRDY